MTDFQSRKTIRDAITALFTPYKSDDGSQLLYEVYNHRPTPTEVIGYSPLLYVTTAGTERRFAMLNTNPSKHHFLVSVMVMEYDKDATPQWFSEDAEDKLDDLEELVSQVIRDNVQSANWTVMQFVEGLSSVESRVLEGQLYIVETRMVSTFAPSGTS